MKEGGQFCAVDAVPWLLQHSLQEGSPPGCPDGPRRQAEGDARGNCKYVDWIFKCVFIRRQMSKSDLITDEIMTQL